VHLQTSLVQSFVLLFKNFEEVVQIITLKRFGGAPHYNQLALLSRQDPQTAQRGTDVVSPRSDPSPVNPRSSVDGGEVRGSILVLLGEIQTPLEAVDGCREMCRNPDECREMCRNPDHYKPIKLAWFD
jgi:hypothetical protein